MSYGFARILRKENEMKKTGILITLLVLAAVPALAQDRSGTFELSPFGGGNFSGTLYTYSPTTLAEPKLDVGDAGTYGVRFGYNFSSRGGIEFAWAHATNGLFTGPSRAFAPRTKLGDFDTDAFEANGVFGFTRGKVVPYFTIGGGVHSMKLSLAGQSSSTETKFVGNLGVGVKFWITPRFGIRLEGRARSTYVGNGSSCHDHSYCDNTYNDSNWYTSGEATGGLSFAF
jgi:hypothetical protein